MTTRRIRTYHDVADPGAEDILAQVVEQNERLAARLAGVGRLVIVASGKGGVGKSAITANLAAALAARGRCVGAADADLNGPSLARMLGAGGQSLRVTAEGVEPAEGAAGVRVVSMDLLLSGDDAPLRWRAPDAPDFLWQSLLEGGVLRELLADVSWGELDYLLIDAPPGTDKITRLLQLLPAADTLLLVTTPSEIARFVVAKSERLAREAGAREIGLVVNMSAHVCETCGARTPLFDDVDAGRLPESGRTDTWADIPFDRRLASTTDRGEPAVLVRPDSPAAMAILALADRLEKAASLAAATSGSYGRAP